MTIFFILKSPNDILFEYWLSLYYCLRDKYTDITIITTVPIPNLQFPILNFLSCKEILRFIKKHTKNDIILFLDFKYVRDTVLQLPRDNIYIYFNRDPYHKFQSCYLHFFQNNFQIIEYYENNRNYLCDHVDKKYHSKIYIIPQLFHKNDHLYTLPSHDNPAYDVGMIFRYGKHATLNRRELFWNRITGMKKLLISDFGMERDSKIIHCKIIINIRSKTHHGTDGETVILENRESLRIDRIISKKILVVSEPYQFQNRYNDQFIIQVPLDRIMTTCQDILGNYHKFHREHFKNYNILNYEAESETYIQPILTNLS